MRETIPAAGIVCAVAGGGTHKSATTAQAKMPYAIRRTACRGRRGKTSAWAMREEYLCRCNVRSGPLCTTGFRHPFFRKSRFKHLRCGSLPVAISGSPITIDLHFGGIAQLVERQLCKLDVRGSNPLASKNIAECGFRIAETPTARLLLPLSDFRSRAIRNPRACSSVG